VLMKALLNPSGVLEVLDLPIEKVYVPVNPVIEGRIRVTAELVLATADGLPGKAIAVSRVHVPHFITARTI
jgi:hypothetical protein